MWDACDAQGVDGAGGEDARIVPGWGESTQTAPEETLDQRTDW
jgi:hypothetical protein